MFKLPICPYCNTIYRYGDVNKILSKKSCECYHCKRSFKISKKGIFILFAMMVVFAVTTDIIELNIFKSTSFIVLMITNIIVILLFLLFIPFFIGFKKAENKNNPRK